MARSFRTACLLAAPLTAALGVLPATAQFVNPFEALFGPPPRPPSGVPGGRPASAPQQQGYPQDPQYQQPALSGPGAAGTARRRRAEPALASARWNHGGGRPARARRTNGAAWLPPGQRQPRGTPQPADTSPQPGDEVIPEPPSQKITNKGALFSGLDKITGRIITFDAAIGETVQFGALQVTPRICYTRPPTETSNTDAFIEVDEVTLQGEVKRIFTGWVFAASPGLHAVEHPIYDVWLTDCKNPVVAATAPPPEAAPPPVTPAKPPAAPRRAAVAASRAAARRAAALIAFRHSATVEAARCSRPARAIALRVDAERSSASTASACAPVTGCLVPSAPKSPSPRALPPGACDTAAAAPRSRRRS